MPSVIVLLWMEVELLKYLYNTSRSIAMAFFMWNGSVKLIHNFVDKPDHRHRHMPILWKDATQNFIVMFGRGHRVKLAYSP